MAKKCKICGKEFLSNKNAQKCCSLKCSKINRQLNDKEKYQRYKQEKAIFQKACKHCGASFESINKNQKYCSKSCAHSDREYTVKCKTCGKKFIAGQKNGMFCSYECEYGYIKETNARKIHTHTCAYCGEQFNSAELKRKYCSVECQKRATIKHDSTCWECGKQFTKNNSSHSGRFCSRNCFLRYIGAHAYIHKHLSEISDISSIRRAVRYNVQYEHINVLQIFEKNNWTCGICGEKVDRKLTYPHPMSASLDHIIPLSKGGTHTKENVQLAHLLCNIKKADRLIPKEVI